ncbi:MAG: hypothetical protein HOW73_48365 [Polyangiaceae bacterium]|nr:hypothetical protein [Polyangiaceae bacterium]
MHRRRTPRSLLGALTAACLCAAVTAHADDAVERARELDARARAAYEAGDRRAAAEAFHAANELVPHPATKYNEARAWEAAGELPRAAEAFEAALAVPVAESAVLDDERSTDARARLEALRSRLGKLRIAGPAGTHVAVAHIENAPVPIAPFVTPGDLSIRVVFPGGATETRAASVGAGETLVVELVESKKAALPVVPRRSPDTPMPPTSIAGFVLLGAGVASGVASVVFGVRTNDAVERFNDSGFTDADARSEAVTNKILTNTLLGVALGAGAAGTICLAIGLTTKVEPDVAVDVGPGSARLRFHF